MSRAMACSPVKWAGISRENGFWRRLRARKDGMAGLILIGVLAVSCYFPAALTPFDPDAQGDLLTEQYLPPSAAHYFGTDRYARDVFARVLYGGRISLTIALCTVALSVSIGMLYGAFSGYRGGFVDAVMMRLLDFLLAFPIVFLVLAVVAIFRPSHWFLIPLLAFSNWMETARLIRGEVLSLKEREFVLAARSLGLGRWRILFRHILPHAVTPALVTIPLKVGDIILLESALSYLGVGVQPPTASWGNIISDGRDVLLEHWWVSTFAGLFLVLAVLGFNFVGESIRAANTPRSLHR